MASVILRKTTIYARNKYPATVLASILRTYLVRVIVTARLKGVASRQNHANAWTKSDSFNSYSLLKLLSPVKTKPRAQATTRVSTDTCLRFEVSDKKQQESRSTMKGAI